MSNSKFWSITLFYFWTIVLEDPVLYIITM